MEKKHRYTIGELSSICNLSKKTLRFYDEKGILKPSIRDENNSYRYYSEEQILKGLIIDQMKKRGFTLHEMRMLFVDNSSENLQDSLKKKIVELEKEIKNKKAQLQYTRMISDWIEEASMLMGNHAVISDNYQMKLMEVPEEVVIYTRYWSSVNVNNLFWGRYAEIQHILEDTKAITVGPFSAVFHDSYTNQFFFDEGDLEVYVPIERENYERLSAKEFVKKNDAFIFAYVEFIGNYKDMLPAYIELIKRINDKGYVIAGPAIERYLVEFSYGFDSKNWITQLGFPVEKVLEK